MGMVSPYVRFLTFYRVTSRIIKSGASSMTGKEAVKSKCEPASLLSHSILADLSEAPTSSWSMTAGPES
jgi:hypothetical protein